MKRTRLSDIFNADSIRNKKRILDRFEINKKEKRLFLDAIEEIENNGGCSEGGEDEDAEYISFKGETGDEALSAFTSLSNSVRLELEEGGVTANLVVSPFTYAMQYSQIMPAAIKFNRNEIQNTIVGMDNSGNPIIQSLTAIEFIAIVGQSFVEKFNSLPRITKEEFYAL